MREVFLENLRRAEQLLSGKELERLIVFGPANIQFLLGTDAASIAVIGDEPVLITPRLEYLRAVEEKAEGRVVAVAKAGEWSEYEEVVKGDFYDALSVVLKGFDPGKIGVAGASKDTLRKLAKKLGGKPVDISGEFKMLRRRKTDKELALMRRAARVAEQAMQKAVDQLEPGVTEAEVAAAILELMVSRGYTFSFYPIVAFGEHSAHPHAKPSTRKLREGELVKIDLGARVGGYCSDMTRTFVYGKASRRQRHIYEAVLESQEKSMEEVAAGISAEKPYRTAFKSLKERGLAKYFNHGLGHGVGIEIHEPPYLTAGTREKLVAGDVVTVEPGVYMAGYGGVRIEDMVVVKDGGAELLTFFDKFLEI